MNRLKQLGWILLALAAAGGISVYVAVPDLWVVYRRMTLPKTIPWPIEAFQPQEKIMGGTPFRFPEALPEARTIKADALADAVSYAKETDSQALLIYRHGLLEKVWYADGVNDATILHSYTMHYTALVLLIGIAIDEGKIKSVDEPAATYISEWRNDERAKITIKNLLQMNAGLDMRFDAHKSEGMFSRDALAYWGGHTKSIMVTYPLVHPIGSQFDYDYIVPELLGLILERATGRRYADYLSEKLWRPLGNRDASVWLNRWGGEAHQDAGLFSGAMDWMNVGVMMLNQGRVAERQIVSSNWIEAMRTPSDTNPNFGMMYLGSPFTPERRMATDPRVTYVVHAVEPFAADDVAYIDGYGGQRAYIVPSLDLVIVRIGGVARKTWDNSKLVNIIVRGIVQP